MDAPPGDFRPRNKTESFIHNDQVSPSLLKKQISYPAQGRPDNYSSYTSHTPQNVQGTSRYNTGLGVGSVAELQDITDGDHVRQQDVPQLTSTPQHHRVAPPQIYQPSTFIKMNTSVDIIF